MLTVTPNGKTLNLNYILFTINKENDAQTVFMPVDNIYRALKISENFEKHLIVLIYCDEWFFSFETSVRL